MKQAKLAYLTRPDPDRPVVLNLHLGDHFVQAFITEDQRENLILDAAKLRPNQDQDEHDHIAGAVASLEGRAA